MANGYEKKCAIVRIYQILQECSDYDHPMTQKNLIDSLAQKGIVLARKAVADDIEALRGMGVDIQDGAKNGVYLADRLFEPSELRLLIDSVMCSRYIPAKRAKEMIQKLRKLGGNYFHYQNENIHSVSENSKTDNNDLFYTIDVLDEAIETGKQVQFDYYKYQKTKKLGKTKMWVISPYTMALHNQKYYLVGFGHGLDKIVHMRIDHIKGIRILKEKAKPICEVPGYEKGIHYGELTSSKPYMFSDPFERIELLVEERYVDDVMDAFGNKITILDQGDHTVKVILRTSPMAMQYWALQYVNHVTVLSPEKLRMDIIASLKEGMKKYQA